MKTLLTLIGLITTIPAFAQTATVNYVLQDVWLDPDITHPWEPPQLMSGTIAWTYTVGDFDNGSGAFTALNLPWHNGQGPALAWTIEVDQVEVTMPGNWHDWGADVSLKLAPALALGQPATVDLVFSKFDIEAWGIVRKGHMLSGSLVPESPIAYCTAGASASGCQASISATGTASATATSGFDLMASSVEGNKDGLFFFGPNGRQASPWGNGTSFQCVVPPVNRGGLLTGVGTAGTCDGSFSQDLNARWTTKPNQNPGAGATVQAQLWYRDPLNTSNQTTSLSDALEFGVAP
jgi:hypothetical protein